MELKEALNIIIPAIISIIGFTVTIVLTRVNIKNEIKKKNNEQFLERFSSMEFDIAEILQLYTVEKKCIQDNEINTWFPYFIANDRDSACFRHKNTEEKIHRLCGYIATYGTDKSFYYFSMIQNEYCNADSDFNHFIALLALLYTQVRFDATHIRVDYKNWINIRLPKYNEKEKIYDECEKILGSI